MSDFERYNKENYIIPMTVEEKGGHLHTVILGEMAQDHIAGRRVLHVGCNAGTTTYHLQSFKPRRLAGVDVNGEAILAAQKLIPSVQFYHAIAHDMPFEDNSFDTIILFSVLEHMFKSDKALAIKEFERVLVHNGVVLVQIPKATPGSKDQKLRQNAYDPRVESLYHSEKDVHADFYGWESLKFYYEKRQNPNNRARHSSWIAIYRNPKPKLKPSESTTKESDIDLREYRGKTVKMKLDPKPQVQVKQTSIEEEQTSKISVKPGEDSAKSKRESPVNPSAQIRSNWGYDNPHDY